MKKMFVMMMLMVCGLCSVSVSAQIVVMNNTNIVRLDVDGDGVWDQEVNVQQVPFIGSMRCGRNFYNELGRLYCINMWRQYEAMGVNPAQYIPNPENNGDYMQYANMYARYVTVSGNGYGAGMVGAGMVGGVGMPGNASISLGGKNFGFSLSVPVKSNNNPYYTPNASLGVNVKGNYLGVSVPVSINTNKNRNNTTTYAPTTTTTRTTTTAPTTTRRTTPSAQTSRSTRMTQAEVSAMTNSAYYY